MHVRRKVRRRRRRRAEASSVRRPATRVRLCESSAGFGPSRICTSVRVRLSRRGFERLRIPNGSTSQRSAGRSLRRAEARSFSTHACAPQASTRIVPPDSMARPSASRVSAPRSDGRSVCSAAGRKKVGRRLLNSFFYPTFVPRHGEVQEWLNWLAWKVSKRQKRFRGSNPLLSAENAQGRPSTDGRPCALFAVGGAVDGAQVVGCQ